jgi:flagellum-specific peptidoglycan hydrolase FlgJ
VRRLWPLVLVVLLLVLVPGGAAVVGVRLVTALRGRRAVFEAVRSEVARQLEELRPDLTAAERDAAARIVAAQAVLETGGGATPAWREGWNFGNVTAGAGWTGPVVQAGDLEYRAGTAEPVRIAQRFRKYGSLGEAVSDFVRVLNWPRYRAAREALMRGDAATYALLLREDDPRTVAVEGGYYTAPLTEYRAGLLALLEKLA